MNTSPSDRFGEFAPAPRAITCAAWHSLLWLVVANAIGVGIAILLLLPGLNPLLGEWTYGRWIIVHMNLELYGWTSLPLVAFAMHAYGADRGSPAKWCRPVLCVWSAALCVGSLSWLAGRSSGKLFLDWTGYARVVFPLALLVLWLLLVAALIANWRGAQASQAARAAKILGLFILFAVPFAIYIQSGPGSYPAVNPDTGGPTGASQLESSLAIVLILLVLPFGITRRSAASVRRIPLCWAALLAESVLCIALGSGDISHHRPAQYLGLGTMVVWIPLMPAYYAAFEWSSNTRRWRLAFLWWWAALVLIGWIFFLPGVLDRFKFTDGLVGHSFVAMAGFTSSLLIFVMIQLMGEDGWVFNRSRSFYLWHASVIGYIVVVTIAGWHEGVDPTFTIVPGAARNVLYTLRLLTGILMLLASLDWFVDVTTVLRKHAPAFKNLAQEQTA
jgi:cytochrome c oxidase cbb3-type subunit I